MEVYISGSIVQATERHDKEINQVFDVLQALSDRISHLESRLKALENPKKED